MTHRPALGLLNSDRHRDVRIMPGSDMASARALNHARIGLSETGVAASDYPLLFMKDGESGHFRLVALFGTKTDVNFFVINDQWQATYLPASVLGLPFHLAGAERLLCIDEDSDLVTTDVGAPLYSADGEETADLSQIRVKFDHLRDDLAAADEFAAMLAGMNLIRPLPVILEFDDGASDMVTGLYSISQERLAAMDDAAIIDLHRRHYLDKMHIIINSLAQIYRLQQLYPFHCGGKSVRLIAEMAAG